MGSEISAREVLSLQMRTGLANQITFLNLGPRLGLNSAQSLFPSFRIDWQWMGPQMRVKSSILLWSQMNVAHTYVCISDTVDIPDAFHAWNDRSLCVWSDPNYTF